MRGGWSLEIRCPKCRRQGFLSRRWTNGSYFPQVASSKLWGVESYYQSLDSGREISPYTRQLKELKVGNSVRVYEYTGVYSLDDQINTNYEYRSTSGPGRTGKLHIVKQPPGSKQRVRKRIFQVIRRPELRYYVGHYDAKKFSEKMIDYRKGKIKSRPNGRVWCSITDQWEIPFGDGYIPLSQYYDIMSSRRKQSLRLKKQKAEEFDAVMKLEASFPIS